MITQDDQTKKGWFYQFSSPKVKKLVERVAEENESFGEFLRGLELLFPKLENDIYLRDRLRKIPILPKEPSPQEVETMLLKMEEVLSLLSPEAMSDQEKLLTLISKLHPQTFKEIRQDRSDRRQCDNYNSLKTLLREKAREDFFERYLFQQQRDPKMKEKLNVASVVDERSVAEPNSGFQNSETRGRGKGKGKGQGKGKGEGKGKGRWQDPSFKAKIQCKFCQKIGHYESDCWTKQKVERQAKSNTKN